MPAGLFSSSGPGQCQSPKGIHCSRFNVSMETSAALCLPLPLLFDSVYCKQCHDLNTHWQSFCPDQVTCSLVVLRSLCCLGKRQCHPFSIAHTCQGGCWGVCLIIIPSLPLIAPEFVTAAAGASLPTRRDAREAFFCGRAGAVDRGLEVWHICIPFGGYKDLSGFISPRIS